MLTIKEKFALQSVRNKIIIAFTFGCLVVIFSWAIARVVFKETFATIEKIAEPNPKLRIVNDLFTKVNKLDRVQKVYFLQNPNKAQGSLVRESRAIIQSLDTLQSFYDEDTIQVKRLEQMKQVLLQRDRLFFKYLKFRSDLLNNTSLSNNMRELSDYISENVKQRDSSIVTTKKKTTTTTTLDLPKEEALSDKQASFFKRLFSKKKTIVKAHKPAKKFITEDVTTTIDTLAIAQRDSFIKDMESAIGTIEKDQYAKGSVLMNHELKLANASNTFIDELQLILHQIQAEEISDLQNNTQLLSNIFNKAFNRIGIILLVFLILALILIFLMFSDISQNNKNRLELIEAKEKAQHMEQVKERFLANMSHEIRTPLQSIIGYSEQLIGGQSAEKESLEAIHRSSEYLLQIVNEVLDYSRITSGKFNFEVIDFDMEEIVAEVADTMESRAELKNIQFKFRSEITGEMLFKGDSFRLKQILYNLLSNAIKFTDSGGVSFSVSAKSDSKKTEFTFEIKDTGIGMTEKELGKIFNVFEQATESTQRYYGGTGLGLNIAKTLVDMQRGKMHVTSEKNKGTIFTLTLGYLNSLNLKNREIQTHETGIINFTGKVLVVDDDELILKLCSIILQKHNIDHVCYNSSEKVLKDAWDNNITLVLMDIRMPGINGFELCKLLRQRIQNDIKFVALTAQVLPHEREAILKQGFNTVLLKPFREKDLLKLFTNFIIDDPDTADIKSGVIDLSSIKFMCGNDTDQFKKTLILLVNDTLTDTQILKDAYEAKNNTVIGEVSHKLAGKTGQAGAWTLAHDLRNIERDANSKAENVFEELDRFVEAIRSNIPG